VTEPGEIEHVAPKVVPYYVTGFDEEYVEPQVDPEPVVEPEQPKRTTGVPRALVGMIALGLAVVMAVLHVVGIVVASGNDYGTATAIAWVAIVISGVAVLGGVAAIILRRGRGWGIAAIVLGVLANPVILLYLLRLVSTLQAG
jgi:hypothetical protein